MMVLTATKFEGKSDISIRNNRIGSLQRRQQHHALGELR
tara:strand:- start:67 stop:183 length:117 start_codon:yes stop_codon:yes gene_type:complete